MSCKFCILECPISNDNKCCFECEKQNKCKIKNQDCKGMQKEFKKCDYYKGKYMNIELNPQYKIGQEISKVMIFDDCDELDAGLFIISNIKGVYNYKNKTINYLYELTFKDYKYVYGWVYLD